MVGPQVDCAEPILIRNNRFAIVLMFASGMVCLVLAPCTLLVAVYSLLGTAKPPFDKVYGLLAWACGAYLLGRAGRFLLRQASGMKFNHVEFTRRGVGFGIKSGKNETKEFFSWKDIQAVTCSRIAHLCVCTVQGAGDRAFSFDSYSFLRPRQIAIVITSHLEKNCAEDSQP